MGRQDDDNPPASDDTPGPPGGEPLSLRGLRIPDDARELDADVRALRRERRASARRDRLHRLLVPRGWRRYGVSGPVAVVIIALIAGLASMIVLFEPRRSVVRTVPLATNALRPVGAEGGLLPDVVVYRMDGGTSRLRDLRPAVVALLPTSCGCENRLQQVGLAALRYRLPYVLIGRNLPAQPADLDERTTFRASEPTGVLARSYRLAEGPDEHPPVLLLVRADGVVNRIVTDLPSVNALDGELAVLSASAAVDSGPSSSPLN